MAVLGYIKLAISLYLGVVLSYASEQKQDIKGSSLSELEERKMYIETELEKLAHYTPRGGIGPVGYRSVAFGEVGDAPWVEIDLGEEMTIDAVALAPCLIRDPVIGYRSDAFPEALVISNEKGEILADVKREDIDLPRIAPLIIPLNGQRASRIRVMATTLTTRAFDGRRNMQFSEILVYSGDQNVALRKAVTVSGSSKRVGRAWNPQFLTDGSLPYLMNSKRGESSLAYLSPNLFKPIERLSLTMDLEDPHLISEVHLHTVDQSDTVPQQAPSGIGMPVHLLIEGSMKSDFSDAQLLLEVKRESSFDVSPVMIWPFAEQSCRYIRISSLLAEVGEDKEQEYPMIGFAEIELLSDGENVALGKTVSVDDALIHKHRSLVALTDGRNVYGDILEQKEWLLQLARRHDLERELPIISEALQSRYQAQKSWLRWLAILGAALIASVCFFMLWSRMRQERKISQIKERFAADLHDEIGAKVHGIGMLSDLAQKAIASPEKLEGIHKDIRSLSERLGTSVRHCTDLLEAEGLYTDMEVDMRRMADRLMIDYELKIEGKEYLDQLSQLTCLDLLLFYKECLVNINRHAEASSFQSHLLASEKKVDLKISDNGRGLSEIYPASLKRRAHLMGAKIITEPVAGGGTCIHLYLKINRKHKKKS